MPRNLYNLTEEMKQLEEYLMDDYYDVDIIEEEMEALLEDIGGRVDELGALNNEIDAQINYIKNEKQRLNEMQKKLKNKQASMLTGIQKALDTTGKKKIKGDLFTASLRKKPFNINVVDSSKLPKEYLIKQEPKVDLVNLKKYVKNNGVVDGVEIKSTEYSLNLK